MRLEFLFPSCLASSLEAAKTWRAKWKWNHHTRLWLNLGPVSWLFTCGAQLVEVLGPTLLGVEAGLLYLCKFFCMLWFFFTLFLVCVGEDNKPKNPSHLELFISLRFICVRSQVRQHTYFYSALKSHYRHKCTMNHLKNILLCSLFWMLHNYHHFLRFYFVEFGQHPRREERLKFGKVFNPFLGRIRNNNKQINFFLEATQWLSLTVAFSSRR